ncbi:MAG TPA: VOC family protein [Candidatus Binatia bacterium]
MTATGPKNMRPARGLALSMAAALANSIAAALALSIAAALALSIAATLLVAVAVLPSPAAEPDVSSSPLPRLRVRSVDSIALNVADAAGSTRFYRDVLGFEVRSEEDLAGRDWQPAAALWPEARLHVVHLQLGQERLDLARWLDPRGAAIAADTRANDAWSGHVAIVVRDMATAVARLAVAGARAVSSSPQVIPEWNPTSGGIVAYSFLDPDGHALELVHFPEGKGDARWQRPGKDLFQGIDHVAIVAADTERSLAFWVDGLGLALAGHSNDYGIEQARLTGIASAHVRVSALRAQSGPAIELVEFLAPAGGRPRPATVMPDDLVSTSIVVGVDGDTPSRELADPDGHLLATRHCDLRALAARTQHSSQRGSGRAGDVKSEPARAAAADTCHSMTIVDRDGLSACSSEEPLWQVLSVR